MFLIICCVPCPPTQGSPVLSLSELSKAPLHNGPPAPLPVPEGSSSRLSPPNVSALLDISLPGPPEDVLSQGEPATHISDSIIEIAISSGQYGEGPGDPDFARGGFCTAAVHTTALRSLLSVECLLRVGCHPTGRAAPADEGQTGAVAPHGLEGRAGPPGLCSPQLRGAFIW